MFTSRPPWVTRAATVVEVSDRKVLWVDASHFSAGSNGGFSARLRLTSTVVNLRCLVRDALA